MSKETIKNALTRAGFEIISFDLLEENKKRGNSLLVSAKLKVEDSEVEIHDDGKIYDLETYENFNKDLNSSLKKLNDFIKDNINSGKRITGFGAGGRGVMTLAAIPYGNKISFICNNNTRMEGFYTPKTHIKIVNPSYLKENPVDILIVFSFGYITEIRQQVKNITDKNI